MQSNSILEQFAVGPAMATALDLVEEVERRVAGGGLAPGTRLPPVRAMAEHLGLAPNTVAAAYRTLGERGLVVGRGRRGTFVAEPPDWSADLDEALPAGLVDLSSGNPDPAMLPPLAAALDELDARHRLYGEAAVDEGLARLVADELHADGVDASALAIVGGALDGLERVLGARLRVGDRVAIEDPGYPAVAHLVGAMGFRVVPVAVDGAGITPAALADALERGIEALVVTPRAQNPTGAAFDAERVGALRELLGRDAQVVVVEDDHAGLVAGTAFHHLVDPGRSAWATIRSMAKTLGPDLRVAALAGDATTVARVARRQAAGAGWVSHILQRLVASQLASEVVRAGLDDAKAEYARRRRAVVDTLDEAGIEVAGRSGLNVWIPVDDEARVVTAMERRGYAVRAGSRYRTTSQPGVRLSIGLVDADTARSAAAVLAEIIAPGAGAGPGQSGDRIRRTG